MSADTYQIARKQPMFTLSDVFFETARLLCLSFVFTILAETWIQRDFSNIKKKKERNVGVLTNTIRHSLSTLGISREWWGLGGLVLLHSLFF